MLDSLSVLHFGPRQNFVWSSISVLKKKVKQVFIFWGRGEGGRGVVKEHALILVTYLVEHFNVSRSEIVASSEKPAVTSWISWRNGVCIAASGVRSWVTESVVRYVDDMMTKRGSVVGAVIHCVMLILILSELDRIISIFVVKREHESFTGISITATRTWNENKWLTHS